MKIEKLIGIVIITIIATMIGTISIKADTINYNYKQYRVQYYSLGQGTTAWNSWTNFGSGSSFAEGYGVSAVAIRFGQSNNFINGNTYRIVIDTGFSPSGEKQYLNYEGSSCYGSVSTSSWNNVDISDCEYVGMADTPNSVHRKFVFDVTPSANYQGIQINITFSGTAEIRGVNVYNTSTITTGPDITGAIDEQTLVIQDGFEDITNKITEVNENLINAITENNTVCELYDKNSIKQDNAYIGWNNQIINSSTEIRWGITDYIKIDSKTIIKDIETQDATDVKYCFYNVNKEIINCYTNSTLVANQQITIPTNSSYVRFTINKTTNRPQIQICKQQGQAITDKLDQDHDYDTEDISDQVDNEHEKQQEILEELDDSYMDSITWQSIADILNGNKPNWILQKMNGFARTMNQKIFNFITVMLSLGLIKLILGR